MQFRHRGGAACLLALMTSSAQAAGPTPDVETIRRELRQTWDSLQGLQFRCDEYLVDPEGRRRPNIAIHELSFAYMAGGRWAHRLRQRSNDGAETLINDQREDGRKLYSVFAFDGHPEVIDSVVIQGRQGSEASYAGPMHVVLWLWIPGGKPPHTYLDSGGRLEVVREPGRADRVLLTATHKTWPLRIELDPDHDWLPSHVQLGDFDEYTATKFRRDNGRWFYDEGRHVMKFLGGGDPKQSGEIVPRAPGSETRQGFAVSELKINRAIPAATFTLPPLASGVAVSDESGGGVKGTGTASDRRARVHRYAPAHAGTSSEPIVASRDPIDFPWGRALAIGSASLLVVAGLLVYRHARTNSSRSDG